MAIQMLEYMGTKQDNSTFRLKRYCVVEACGPSATSTINKSNEYKKTAYNTSTLHFALINLTIHFKCKHEYKENEHSSQ